MMSPFLIPYYTTAAFDFACARSSAGWHSEYAEPHQEACAHAHDDIYKQIFHAALWPRGTNFKLPPPGDPAQSLKSLNALSPSRVDR